MYTLWRNGHSETLTYQSKVTEPKHGIARTQAQTPDTSALFLTAGLLPFSFWQCMPYLDASLMFLWIVASLIKIAVLSANQSQVSLWLARECPAQVHVLSPGSS